MQGGLLDWAFSNANFASEENLNQTLIEVIGNKRVLIENHKGLTCYSKKDIHIKTTFGVATIAGEEMMLACMSKHRLVVCGSIYEISLCRG